MALESKELKVLSNICTKLTNIFTDFYITKQGYIMSLDANKPFVLMLDEDKLKLFTEQLGEFAILHISNIREFKKEFNDYYEIVSSGTETKKVVDSLTEKINLINKCDTWENFLLSDNEQLNEELLVSLFKKNDYINFNPKNVDGPDIILTKSLLPIVSEKNYTQVYYSAKKISSEIYVIIFDFDFDLFRIYMLHHYIPIDEGKKVD